MGALEVAASMGISPSEFWGLTYGELVAYSRGYSRRNKESSRLWAHLAAAVINSIPAFKRKRSVTGDQLLGLAKRHVGSRGMGDRVEEQHR